MLTPPLLTLALLMLMLMIMLIQAACSHRHRRRTDGSRTLPLVKRIAIEEGTGYE
jgi:hypothetical protein